MIIFKKKANIVNVLESPPFNNYFGKLIAFENIAWVKTSKEKNGTFTVITTQKEEIKIPSVFFDEFSKNYKIWLQCRQ